MTIMIIIAAWFLCSVLSYLLDTKVLAKGLSMNGKRVVTPYFHILFGPISLLIFGLGWLIIGEDIKS